MMNNQFEIENNTVTNNKKAEGTCRPMPECSRKEENFLRKERTLMTEMTGTVAMSMEDVEKTVPSREEEKGAERSTAVTETESFLLTGTTVMAVASTEGQKTKKHLREEEEEKTVRTATGMRDRSAEKRGEDRTQEESMAPATGNPVPEKRPFRLSMITRTTSRSGFALPATGSFEAAGKSEDRSAFWRF